MTYSAAPRLRISGDNPFAHAAFDAGHLPSTPTEAELVFDPQEKVRPGQICAGFGCSLQDLDSLRDNLAFALLPLPGGTYGVQASDQLAYTIVELLAAEIGAPLVPIPPAAYDQLLLALSFAGFAGVVRQEARDCLQQVFGNDQIVEEILAQDFPQRPLPIADLERALATIDSPGLARDFLALVNHSAAYFDDRDIELWATITQPESYD